MSCLESGWLFPSLLSSFSLVYSPHLCLVTRSDASFCYGSYGCIKTCCCGRVKTRLRLIWCEWMMHFCIFGSNPRVCSLLRSRALLAVFRQVRKLLAATWMNGRPPVGCYKCNVDTAHLEQNGAVGFAAVVCDYDGHVVKCFPEFGEALLNPCLAEAFAIHEVLS
ncbi:hypothetical protein PVK06_028106 [Gossypium arboreum]|uniref:RNase H type-1 domain-containing protein n=1 Tax=Gossypium arboreum TaxID=29729 RepID=A0ABR0P3G5_GOSAR|nr:hypothetical protein PVK06_028106 [Gossypium arboreum]